MRTRCITPLIVGSLLAAPFAGCASGEAVARQASVEDSSVRVDRVLNGLRPRVEVIGAAAVRWPLTERMAAYKVPGVSIAIIDSGRLVWAGGFGVKEAGRPEPVTATTIFQAASLSKPVAVSAMLRLVERGALSLDTNVNRYLTSWKLPENRFTEQAPVTLRHLARHTGATSVSGFPGYKDGQPLPRVPEILDGKSPANTQPVRVDTVPGLRFRYSGGGSTILQQLLVDVTETPFPALVHNVVFNTLGMRHSAYEQPLSESRATDAARGHDRAGTVIPGRWHVYPELAAAGLWSTPRDLATWSIAIAAARVGRSDSFLSRATVTEMFNTVQGRTPVERVGLGLFFADSGRGLTFYHGGENEGFLNYFVMFPEIGQGAVIMTNGANGAALLVEIAHAIGAEYDWPGYGQFAAPLKVPAVAVDSTLLAQHVGHYALDVAARTTLRIVREGTRLFLHGSWAILREELYPESPTTFISSATANGPIASRA